jgi:hypothetical protein
MEQVVTLVQGPHDIRIAQQQILTLVRFAGLKDLGEDRGCRRIPDPYGDLTKTPRRPIVIGACRHHYKAALFVAAKIAPGLLRR